MHFQQWVKNLLIFVPAIASNSIFDGLVFGNATLAFFSFGFATSAGCIIDDLLDLEEDRRHLTKKSRPFASGRMFIGTGIALVVTSLSASAVIANLLPRAFVPALISFFALTFLYRFFSSASSAWASLPWLFSTRYASLPGAGYRERPFAVVIGLRVFLSSAWPTPSALPIFS